VSPDPIPPPWSPEGCLADALRLRRDPAFRAWTASTKALERTHIRQELHAKENDNVCHITFE
jgi:hypothetical protein